MFKAIDVITTILHYKSGWCCSSYGSKYVYIQDGRQASILNDIKNLFDVHNPQTVPLYFTKGYVTNDKGVLMSVPSRTLKLESWIGTCSWLALKTSLTIENRFLYIVL